MDRRTAVRNMAFLTGGVTLLARCGFGEQRLPVALNNLNVSIEQEDLLKEIVAAIIPDSDIPGAAALEVHNFVWVMADDCLEGGEQEKFMKGIEGFNVLLKHDRDLVFEKVKAEERTDVLSYINSLDETYQVPSDEDGTPKFDLDSIKYFLGRVKGFTIQGFMQSQYVMTEIMPYKLVPGPMPGCVENDPNKRINING